MVCEQGTGRKKFGAATRILAMQTALNFTNRGLSLFESGVFLH